MPSVRKDMIESEMKRALSEIIREEIRDPAVPEITSVMNIRVAQDLSFAKIGISVLSDDGEALTKAVAALNRAAGFIRHELRSRIELRVIPKLSFVEDRSVDNSIRIQKVIDDIHRSEDR